jgi:hypothetical protein
MADDQAVSRILGKLYADSTAPERWLYANDTENSKGGFGVGSKDGLQRL